MAESGAGCGQAFDWQLKQQKDLCLSEVEAAAESDLRSQNIFHVSGCARIKTMKWYLGTVLEELRLNQKQQHHSAEI